MSRATPPRSRRGRSWQKGRSGCPRNGEKVKEEPHRLARQAAGMCLEQMLEDLPGACDHGVKKNARGFLVRWRGCKLHLDCADCGVPVGPITNLVSVHDARPPPAGDDDCQAAVDLYDCFNLARLLKQKMIVLGTEIAGIPVKQGGGPQFLGLKAGQMRAVDMHLSD